MILISLILFIGIYDKFNIPSVKTNEFMLKYEKKEKNMVIFVSFQNTFTLKIEKVFQLSLILKPLSKVKLYYNSLQSSHSCVHYVHIHTQHSTTLSEHLPCEKSNTVLGCGDSETDSDFKGGAGVIQILHSVKSAMWMKKGLCNKSDKFSDRKLPHRMT